MNKNQYITILVAVILLAFCFFFWRQSRLETLKKEYGQMISLTPASLDYRSVQLPLSGDGLLFYKVKLKELPFPHTIDKMGLDVEGNEIRVTLTGVSFDVNEALRLTKGENLTEDFKAYLPYQSIFTHPLESLALAGIEQVKLNAKFVLKNTGVSRHITGEVQDKKIGKAEFSLSLPENNALVSVHSLTAAPFIQGEFSWVDIGFESPYRSYATSIGYAPPPQGLGHVRIVLQKEEPIK